MKVNDDKETINSIKELFRGYSALDIVETLAISHLWRENISTDITHLFLLAVAFSLKAEEFKSSKQLSSYKDFIILLEECYSLAPLFPTIQDYIPESDWMEIKYYLNEKHYWMLYGGDFSTSYDYLYQFEVLHSATNGDYPPEIFPPMDSLEQVLKFHDALTKGIKVNSKPENLALRQLKVPSEAFWNECKSLFRSGTIQTTLDPVFIKKYELSLNSVTSKDLLFSNFVELILGGKLLGGFFFEFEGVFIPIQPRSFLQFIYDEYGKHLQDNHTSLYSEYSLNKGIQLAVVPFIRERLPEKTFFTFLSAVSKGKKVDKNVYSFAFINDSKIYLFKMLDPLETVSDYDKYLQDQLEGVESVRATIAENPLVYYDHLNGGFIQFNSEHNKTLKPEFIFVIPILNSSESKLLKSKKGHDVQIFFLQDFLSLIDEVEDCLTISQFLSYLKDNVGLTIGVSTSDHFWAYLAFSGVLIEGADSPDFVMIDPNWGSNHRYETLKAFWDIMSDLNSLHLSPRTLLVRKDDNGVIRMVSRTRRDLLTCVKLNGVEVLITSPHPFQNKETSKISHFVVQILEEYLVEYGDRILSNDNSSKLQSLNLIVYPDTLLAEKKFSFLSKSLESKDSIWRLNSGYIDYGSRCAGIRLVYDYEGLQAAFQKKDSRVFEEAPFRYILEELQRTFGFVVDKGIIADLDKKKMLAPRFTLTQHQLPVTFPADQTFISPEPLHFKKARKVVAKKVKGKGLVEGNYGLEKAKSLISFVIEEIELAINSMVNKYDYKNEIPLLIGHIDSLQSKNYEGELEMKENINNEAVSAWKQKHAKEHSEFLKLHKNYRFLIEKFENIHPNGTENLATEDLKILLALVDWLHVFYSASDSLHYKTNPLSLSVSSNYVLDVIYPEEFHKKEESFAQEIAKIRQGELVDQNDRVGNPILPEDYIKDLDICFVKDYEFRLSNLFRLLSILALWGNYSKRKEHLRNYTATEQEIREAFSEAFPEEQSPKITKILDFITLRTSDKDLRLLPIKDTKVKVIPLWESFKRPQRYTLRPVIKIKNRYHWGAYSANKASQTWTSNHLINGYFPIELGENITKQVAVYKEAIEMELEKKSFEIVNRYTKNAFRDFFPHKQLKAFYKNNTYGDFDVIAYDNRSNTFIAIECNDLTPPYSIKDSARLRNELFGTKSSSSARRRKGKIGRIVRRDEFLRKHYKEIADKLDWKIKDKPKFRSIYVSRRTFWWTSFPPKGVEIDFVRIDRLGGYLKDLGMVKKL